MVVPSVGVVIHNDHGGAIPIRSLLQEVQCIHQEILLVGGVGVTRVAVLVALRLQEAYCGLIAIGDRGKEIVEVILVVRRAVVSDFSNASGPSVRVVGGRSVVVEERVVRNVILFRHASDIRLCAARATGGSVRI